MLFLSETFSIIPMYTTLIIILRSLPEALKIDN